MYVKVKDRKYWLEDTGGEGIPLVFLHGFTGSADTFNESISLFSRTWRTIKVDMPGHRKTGELGEIRMKEFCEDLHHILKEMSLNKIHLIGYSMGGRSALSFAAYYPEMIDKLVLESASPGLANVGEQLERQKKDQHLIEKLMAQGLENFVNMWERIPLFDTQKMLRKEVRDRIRKERMSHTSKGLAESLAGMGTGRQPSWWEKLPELSHDVLLVAGMEDYKFIKLNEKMEKLLPHARFHKIPDAGHAVHVEKPEFFAEIVEEFMLQ
ncbi:2-succinyl-6-hydroxy-2,4-cyclohexadiene-1-carboxylate synthase [Halobacillus massiliensis]|uniref:2-succinyl-6-hydroxy-2, 4-cyclohexadiene-1-carboxylate synthase n=1 Tax=Halobacillus massiliensis TaxID=1926286 RepID=UPI0009E224D5|nr:2-succinyl-6-hydroxy-2,4-cyclohexadiene-1-carboxylate synthase [Halobacillus massiliensis]